jgi:hypothetical protein
MANMCYPFCRSHKHEFLLICILKTGKGKSVATKNSQTVLNRRIICFKQKTLMDKLTDLRDQRKQRLFDNSFQSWCYVFRILSFSKWHKIVQDIMICGGENSDAIVVSRKLRDQNWSRRMCRSFVYHRSLYPELFYVILKSLKFWTQNIDWNYFFTYTLKIIVENFLFSLVPTD